jgi:subtilisin family serine protease
VSRRCKNAIDEALRRDVVIVAGAGNNNSGENVPFQPAACPGVLAVGSVNKNGRPDHYSQPQPYVDVAAPGVDIISVTYEPSRSKGFIDRQLRGMSLATAMVSGIIALVRARYLQMPAREVLRRITATAKDVGPMGRDIKSGLGAVRPHEALTAKLPASIPSPVYDAWQKSRRERALHPPPDRTQPSVPNPVPLRTCVVQIGVATGVLTLVATGAAMVATFVVLRRQARSRPTPLPLQPGPEAKKAP